MNRQQSADISAEDIQDEYDYDNKECNYDSDEYYDDDEETERVEHRKEVITKVILCTAVLLIFGGLVLYMIKPQITLPKLDVSTLIPHRAEPTPAPETDVISTNHFVEDVYMSGVPDHDATIVDTVHYKGLSSGETYTITGTLYDKETGEPICTQVKNFVPVEPDGTVEIKFYLNTDLPCD